MSRSSYNTNWEPTIWTEEEKRKDLGTHEVAGTLFFAIGIPLIIAILLILIY